MRSPNGRFDGLLINALNEPVIGNAICACVVGALLRNVEGAQRELVRRAVLGERGAFDSSWYALFASGFAFY